MYSYCIRNGSTTANKSESFENKRIANFIHIVERINLFAQNNKERASTIQAKAIEHKLDMLTVDAILNMMYHGMSAKSIMERCKEKFSPLALYPLRKASYSLKYRIFRLLANNSIGMTVLRAILPAKKPAKK